MKHGIIMLACLILLALTWAVPEASAQDERSGPAEASVRAMREEPTLVAYRSRRHCHYVKGHYRRDSYGRRVYVRAHRHCHTVHRHVA
jgi:hypothetical protein